MRAPSERFVFFSYVRQDDDHDSHLISRLRERLEGELRMVAGEPIPIFQDWKHIGWGDQWAQRLDEAIDGAALLLPVITPAFLKREACRAEVERFLARERRLGRQDLILPLLYLRPDWAGAEGGTGDPLAVALRSRQWEDWSRFRHENWESAAVTQRFEELARKLLVKLEGRAPAKVQHPTPTISPPPVTPPPAARPVASALEEIRRPPASASAGQPELPQSDVVLVVDLQRGPLRSIQEAVKQAPPGATIRIQPGIYREAVEVRKPLALIGDGPADSVFIEAPAHKPALRLQVDTAIVSGLKFHGSKAQALVVSGGAPIVERCELGAVYNVVSLEDGTRATLRGCSVTGLRLEFCGVSITGHAAPQIEDCEIHGLGRCGVEVQGFSRPTLLRNQVSGAWYSAVEGHDGSRLNLKENILSGFTGYGVYLSGAARADLHSNRFSGSNGTGVRAINARVQMRNDELTALGDAIASYEGARIELSGCRISRCTFALRVHRGTIVATGNDLRGNKLPFGDLLGGTIEESDNQL